MLTVQSYGLLKDLAALIASWVGQRFAGLFQADIVPDQFTTLVQLQPATAGGFTALQPVVGWSAPAILGPRAVTYSTPLSWSGTGSGVNNWIFGYYVVDGTGSLCYAERRVGPGLFVGPLGSVYGAVPAYTLRSEFSP